MLAALAFAAPAQAQLAPPPTVLDFEAAPPAEASARCDGSFYPGVTISADAGAPRRPSSRPPRRGAVHYVDAGAAAAQALGVYGDGADVRVRRAAGHGLVLDRRQRFGGEGGYADRGRASARTVVAETRINYTGAFGRPVVLNGAEHHARCTIVCNDG